MSYGGSDFAFRSCVPMFFSLPATYRVACSRTEIDLLRAIKNALRRSAFFLQGKQLLHYPPHAGNSIAAPMYLSRFWSEWDDDRG